MCSTTKLEIREDVDPNNPAGRSAIIKIYITFCPVTVKYMFMSRIWSIFHENSYAKITVQISKILKEPRL